MATRLSPNSYVAPYTGQVVDMLDERLIIRAVTQETGGTYSLFEVCSRPGKGMPLHLQRYEDEALVVFSGSYIVQIGDRTIQVDPGDYTFVPRETLHGYTNIGTTCARLLQLVFPGGIHEQFVAEVGSPVGTNAAEFCRDSRSDYAWIAMVAEKYGVEFFLEESTSVNRLTG